eukprot:6686864-Prymnesium_polylepis.1
MIDGCTPAAKAAVAPPICRMCAPKQPGSSPIDSMSDFTARETSLRLNAAPASPLNSGVTDRSSSATGSSSSIRSSSAI